MEWTDRKKQAHLLHRIDRLRVFAQAFPGWNRLIESGVFLILTTQYPRRSQVVTACIRWALKGWWRYSFVPKLDFHRRYWWYRLVRRWPRERITAMFDREIAEIEDWAAERFSSGLDQAGEGEDER